MEPRFTLRTLALLFCFAAALAEDSSPTDRVFQALTLLGMVVGSLCVCLCVVDAYWTRDPDMWAINPSNIKARDIRPGRKIPKAITPK
jgi:hypothetical protein